MLLRMGSHRWRDLHYELVVLVAMIASIGETRPHQLTSLVVSTLPVYSLYWRRHSSILRALYIVGTVGSVVLSTVFDLVDDVVLTSILVHVLVFFGLHLLRWDLKDVCSHVLVALAILLGSLAMWFRQDETVSLAMLALAVTNCVWSCPSERPDVPVPDLSNFVPQDYDDDSDNDDEERSESPV